MATMRHPAIVAGVFIVLTKIFSCHTREDDESLNFLTEYKNLLASAEGRSSWTGRKKSSQCRGAVTKLKKNEATVTNSHFYYGTEPYPGNYDCRWLFIPDECDLGIECKLGTNHNRRRGRTSDKCLGGDYLRILGYRGTMDKFFCGSTGFNLTFTGQDSVALLFRSLERDEDTEKEARQGLLSSLFGGFNCKIVCKNPEANVISSELGPPLPTNITTTTTLKPTSVPSSTPMATSTNDKDVVDDIESPYLNCKCGESRKGRIVCPANQNCTADLGSIPWQAAIVNVNRRQPWCGAALISDRYVLSAGHCLHGKRADKIQVLLGDHDWTSESEVKEERFNVERIDIHPRFGRLAQFDYDFAILRLRRPVTFSSTIRPVCLPTLSTAEVNPEDNDEDFLAGTIARVSGWGVTDPKNPRKQARGLQTVAVRIMRNSECQAKYNFNPLTDNMMCAAMPNQDACFGDSGGPMTVPTKGVNVLEGVISWGKNCAQPQWPGVYARVRKVLPWILNNTKDSNFCSNKNVVNIQSRLRDIFGSDDTSAEYRFGRGDRRSLY